MIQIQIIARPKLDIDALMQFLHANETQWRRSSGATTAEELAEVAGRICYMSFGACQSPKSNTEYIHHIVRQGHESVLEHVNWTFLISGISRAFSHQIVRHRVGFSFSQLSQQYHDETDATFVEPPQLAEFPDAMAIWKRTISSSKSAYKELLNYIQESELNSDLPARERLRRLRSTARSVLPNATETKLVMTANARALRYFLKVRGGIPGDDEMRLVSEKLLQQLQNEAPALFSDFKIHQLPNGLPMVIHTPHKDET